jgi:hypothetical protein
MNDALKQWLAEGNKITEIPFGVPRDMNVCMNCKGLFEKADLTPGVTRRCKTCHQRHTGFRESR